MNSSVLHRIKKSVHIIIAGEVMENNKSKNNESDQTKLEGSSTTTGRPNLDEINKRNAEEERQDRRSSYRLAGVMALLVAVVIFLVYFFT